MRSIMIEQLSAEDLRRLITEAVRTELSRTQERQPDSLSDRIGMDEASEFTGLSKSRLYKGTSTGDIPHEKFGRRLVFSRKQLAEWIESQTRKGVNISDMADSVLAESAGQKRL